MFRGRGTAVFVTDELGNALDAAFPGQCRLRHIRETKEARYISPQGTDPDFVHRRIFDALMWQHISQFVPTVVYPQNASVFAVHGCIKPRDREPKLDTGVDS